MAGIFISYRRDDVPGDARGIREGLARRFGKANVFMDIENLLAGQRFDRELDKALARCDVLIAVIGPRWMDLLSNRLASVGGDYVSIEIAKALQRDIIVIPVRVGQAGRMPEMPRASDLPEDIRDLVMHQKHDVAHETFARDLAELIAAIRIVQRGDRPRVSRTAIGAALAAVLLLAGGAALWQSGVLGRSVAGKQQADGDQKRNQEEERLATEEKRKQELEKQRLAAEAEKRKQELEKQRLADEAKRKQAATKREPALAVAAGSGQSFRDRLTNGEPCPFCPDLVVAPAGAFTMGSPDSESGRNKDEAPQRTVAFKRPFAVGKFEVTVDQFAAFVSASKHDAGADCLILDAKADHRLAKGGSFRNPGYAQTGLHPVVCVSWNDAKAYVDWLSKETGKPYRLLTESEWEYVARGRTSPGDAPRFFFGDEAAQMCRHGNGADQTNQEPMVGVVKGATFPCSDGHVYTAPVGSFQANPFGLHDVHGNVSEWVEDCVHPGYGGKPPADGAAWTIEEKGDCNRRVIRGGSWFGIVPSLRSASRSASAVNARGSSLGFRVARMLVEP